MQRELKGTAAVESLRQSIREDREQLLAHGITPTLAILRVGDREDDIAYEKSIQKRCEKAGVAYKRVLLPAGCDTAKVSDAVATLNEDRSVHGVLMMRPLSKHIDERAVIETLAETKDVDGMTSRSLAKVFMGDRSGFAPCTAQAVVTLIKKEGIELEGREVVLLGRSLVVGKPLSMLLLQENATVTVCHTRTRELKNVCKRADILIACAGQPYLVDETYVRDGTVLVDVGIHVDEHGNLFGDIHPSAYEKASAYTPVPGGVGSVTSWMLMVHTVQAAKRIGGAI